MGYAPKNSTGALTNAGVRQCSFGVGTWATKSYPLLGMGQRESNTTRRHQQPLQDYIYQSVAGFNPSQSYSMCLVNKLHVLYLWKAFR